MSYTKLCYLMEYLEPMKKSDDRSKYITESNERVRRSYGLRAYLVPHETRADGWLDEDKPRPKLRLVVDNTRGSYEKEKDLATDSR